MDIKHSYAIFLRYWYLVRGNPQRLIQIFLWATLEIVIWGFLTRYLNQVGGADFSFVPTLLGAVVLWQFVLRAQQGMTTPFLEDVWARNLLNIFASPLSIGEYVLGLIGVSIVTSAMGLVVILSLAYLFFGLSVLQLGLLLVPFLAILFAFGISIGIVGITLVLRLGPSGEWYVWPIPTILSPLVAVFYPVSVLPHWMQYISMALPPTYVFEGMRSVILTGTFSADTLIWGTVLAIAWFAVTYLVLDRVYRAAIRNGAIARYGAENF